MYDFECIECSNEFEEFSMVVDKDNVVCPICANSTKSLITQRGGFRFYEGFDDTLQTYITGPPVSN